MPTTRIPRSKKASPKPAATRRATAKATAKSTPKPAGKSPAKAAKPKPTKDPHGGLTAAGRKKFAQTEGAHLRPGVQGKADTPEKQVRKGSFLRRHFANPQGPMERDGEPTRLALSAHAWGEPVPHTDADAKKLADKGSELLEQYHEAKDKAAAKKPKAKRAKK